jgi:predicted RNase H-like HicB family nuclease
MEEIIFLVEESADGGYTAKGMGVSIFSESETIDELREKIKDAIQCHFDEVKPRLVRLHVVKELVFAA